MQEHYVADAFSVLEEAEGNAVLASAGQEGALEGLDRQIAALEALRDEMAAEFRR